jgi:hypothetical protein
LNFGGYAVGSGLPLSVMWMVGSFVVWSVTVNFVHIAGVTEI